MQGLKLQRASFWLQFRMKYFGARDFWFTGAIPDHKNHPYKHKVGVVDLDNNWLRRANQIDKMP